MTASTPDAPLSLPLSSPSDSAGPKLLNTARNTDRIEREGGGELQREERKRETVKKEIQVNRSVEQNNSQEGSAQWEEGHQQQHQRGGRRGNQFNQRSRLFNLSAL